MNPEVQIAAPAPVLRKVKMRVFQSFKWSGREDSNLRPLPPEGVSPRRTRRFSVGSVSERGASACVCSRLIHGRGSTANLGALSFVPNLSPPVSPDGHRAGVA